MNVKPQKYYFVALLVIKSIHGSAPDYLGSEIAIKAETNEGLMRRSN